MLLLQLGDDMPGTIWPVIIIDILSTFRSVLKTPKFETHLLPTILQICRLIDFTVLSGNVTPLMYMDVVFGADMSVSSPGKSRCILHRIAEKFQWAVNQTEPHSQHPRESLISDGQVNDITELENFFVYVPFRLRSAKIYETPLNSEKLRESLRREFIEVSKTHGE